MHNSESLLRAWNRCLFYLARQQELAENLSHTQSEVVQLRKRLGAESELVGSSPMLTHVQQQISRAAPSPSGFAS